MVAPDFQKVNKLRELKAQGLNQTQIAKIFGCTQGAISSMARTHGIPFERGAAARDQTGEKNPAYKDGLSKSTVSRQVQRLLINADVPLHICQRCGYRSMFTLQMHHKDRDRSNNTVENIEVLCTPCHSQEHLSERNRGIDGRFHG